MTENISNLIVAAVSLCGGIFVAILAGITIWTFRDIRSRTRDPFVQILATVVVGVVPIAGILVYFMLRPRETLSEQYVRALEEESLLANIETQEFCPTCGRRVDGDMQFCPSCHTKLRNACGNCGKAVHLSWDLCPYCGSGLTPEMPVALKKALPKQMAAPPAQSLAQAKTERVGVLDRMSNALGGVVDKVSPPKPTAEPSVASSQVIGDRPDEIVRPPPPKANGVPPSPPSAAKKPPQPKPEDLE